MYTILFYNIFASQSIHVSNWSKCHYIDNEYVKYRNISIYENDKLIIDTYHNFKYMSTLYNILEPCPKTENKNMIIAIIYCSIMVFVCICGCRCFLKCPNKIGPI